ncbi:MAG TPA: hypothetical protein VGC63_12405 [Solirubrobacterales bacterium]
MTASAVKRRAFALVGASGSGKSTLTDLLREGFEASGLRVEVVKLAEPLYWLQREFYRYAGREIDLYAQDQPLLESIATHLRSLSPRALVDDFLRRLDVSDADVIINDDLRDPHVDWPTMRQAGFRVIGIAVEEPTRRERLSRRRDLATSMDSKASRDISLIRPDIVLDNNGSLRELKSAAAAVVQKEQR